MLNDAAQGKAEPKANTAPAGSEPSIDFFSFWTDRRWAEKAWPFPRAAETSRITEQALQAYRTLLIANRATAEAMCATARRQQDITFDMARNAISACYVGTAGNHPQDSHSTWKGIMTGYAEAYSEGLEITRAVTDAAFKTMHQARRTEV